MTTTMLPKAIVRSMNKTLAMYKLNLKRIAEKNKGTFRVRIREFVAKTLNGDGYNPTEIGRIINRTHASVICILRQFENHYLHEEDYRNDYNKFIRAYKNKNYDVNEVLIENLQITIQQATELLKRLQTYKEGE